MSGETKPEIVKMWMGWKPGWYLHGIIADTKSDCEMSLCENRWGQNEAQAVEVRIVPEAEYQRLLNVSTPPGLETVPEGTMAVIQSLDDFQVEYKKFTRDNAPGNDYWSGKFLALIGSARAILTRHRATQCQHKWNSISMEFISYDICTECYGIGNKETGVIFCYVPEEKRLKPNNRATQDGK